MKNRYLITPTLLNNWQYLVSSEGDYAKQLEDFKTLLLRVPSTPTQAMIEGNLFEDNVCNGKDKELSPIVKGGVFQVPCKKEIYIKEINMYFLLYGRIDVCKCGHIFDIKHTRQYENPKFYNSYQHKIYLVCVPNAVDFTYIGKDTAIERGDKEGDNSYFEEKYVRKPYYEHEIKIGIINMIAFLKRTNMLDTYLDKWKANKNG